MDISFGCSIADSVRKLDDELPVNFTSLGDFPVLITVSIPSNAILFRETEEINDRRFYGDRQELEFNMKELKTFTLQYANGFERPG